VRLASETFLTGLTKFFINVLATKTA